MENPKHADFYQSLRARIDGWLAQRGTRFRHAKLLLIAPDLFHLMCRLVADPRIAPAEKAKLGAAIAYFVTPIEALPELFIGPGGFLDDLAVAAYALHSVINAGHGEIAREYWAGDGDVLEQVQAVLASADQMIGTGLWQRLRGMIPKR